MRSCAAVVPCEAAGRSSPREQCAKVAVVRRDPALPGCVFAPIPRGLPVVVSTCYERAETWGDKLLTGELGTVASFAGA